MRAPAGRPVVLITSRSFGSGRQDHQARLEAAGLEVTRASPAHDLDELRSLLPRAVAWIAGTGPVTAALLAAAPRLRVVARYGVGTDAVDLAAARQRGITVTNTPGANSAAVADHAVTLLLAALRGVVAGDRRVRNGDWTGAPGRELSALTVGVVGFGRIGRMFTRRLQGGWGCEIHVHDPYLDARQIAEAGAVPASMGELAALSDAVSLHAPGGAVVIDRPWLESAAKPLFLVNTARSDLVDELALAESLLSRRVVAYATDTLGSENRAEDSPLLSLGLRDQVTITPHIAAQTTDAIDAMSQVSTDNVLAVLSDQPAPNEVEER